jgi:GDPmannose 4,6-dehydratase
MWLILQQKEPDDYVIATGHQYSVREFVELAFRELGIGITWNGKGVKEKGIIASITSASSCPFNKGDAVVEVDARYFRPTEVETLLGDATKARKKLGWKPEVSFKELVAEMVSEDLKEAEKDQLCKREGFKVMRYYE